jgi:hypothetical protein
MSKETKELIKASHRFMENWEWVELYCLKFFKPKAFKRFESRLLIGYSYWAAIEDLRIKWEN